MKNKKQNEWKFDFGLCATKADQMIPNSQCEELLELIIEWAEEKELGVGGGYRNSLQYKYWGQTLIID